MFAEGTTEKLYNNWPCSQCYFFLCHWRKCVCPWRVL